jgi:hypothetical protein
MMMATITTSRPARQRDESTRGVSGPLQQLRRYVRVYVGLDGLAIVLVYLALWFWLGLAADYGFFRAFTIDWVQELPRWFRIAVLAVLGTGALALVVRQAARLVRGLRNTALALVLERHFPALLGDRLITAVELADPRKVDRYGYSPLMVEQTTRDAVERLAGLAIPGVLDWQRLKRLATVVALVLVGPYLVAGTAYAALHRADVAGFVHRFNDVAVIWFERNILLIDTIWPRHAYLELLNEELTHGDEMRIGRDTPAPALRVRALKWVIADSNRRRAPEGWRALRWSDLTPGLLGEPINAAAVPPQWREWTVDRVALEIEKPEVRGSVSADAVLTARDALERLHVLASSSSMRRQLRELDIPSEVTVYYRGASSRSDQTMHQLTDNEYAGVPDLKESIEFTVRGNDYYTPPKRITMVPPPAIVELLLDEAQPAYLYHQIPSDGTKDDLRGKKHRFKDRPVSLTGDTSRIDVPVGTDVELTARTDKDLRRPDGVRLLPRPGAAEIKAPLAQLDSRAFRGQFDHVTAPVDFVFRFTDTDGVVGQRHIIIRPVEDLAPEVEVQVEVVRRTNQGYMVTPMAMVPFSGKVRDDHGLAEVKYAYALSGADTGTDPSSRSVLAATVAAQLTGGLVSGLGSVAVLSMGGHGADEDDKLAQTVPMATFEQLARERSAGAGSLAKLPEMLLAPPRDVLLKEYTLDPDLEAFSVERLGLKVADEKAAQPHYRLRLSVVATDNNIETGPRSSQSKERFTVFVVSEHELLAEIAKEEENLRIKLEEAINRLKDGRLKLEKVIQELPDLKPDEFSPLARRTEEVGESIVKSWDATREVYADYKRILKELKANRVQPGMINKVNDKICEPLDGAVSVEFVQSDESMRDFQKKLEQKTADRGAADLARQNLDRLIIRLNGVLEAMADVTTINRIIEMLVKIEKGEREEYERLRKLLKQKQEEVLDNLSDPPKKQEK